MATQPKVQHLPPMQPYKPPPPQPYEEVERAQYTVNLRNSRDVIHHLLWLSAQFPASDKAEKVKSEAAALMDHVQGMMDDLVREEEERTQRKIRDDAAKSAKTMAESAEAVRKFEAERAIKMKQLIIDTIKEQQSAPTPVPVPKNTNIPEEK